MNIDKLASNDEAQQSPREEGNDHLDESYEVETSNQEGML